MRGLRVAVLRGAPPWGSPERRKPLLLGDGPQVFYCAMPQGGGPCADAARAGVEENPAGEPIGGGAAGLSPRRDG